MFLQSNLKYLITNISKFSRDNNIPKRTIESIIYGTRTNIGIETIVNIANALNISLDDLVLKDLSKSDKE